VPAFQGSKDALRRLSPDLAAWIRRMPKVELHLHLDGSLRVDTALDLARTRGVDAPRTRRAMAAVLQAPRRGADQAALLRSFDLPIALLQDAEALERAAAELVEDKAADHVRYLEIRWGPRLHLARGLALADGIAAVCAGAAAGAARTGVEVRLICTAIRSHEPADNHALAVTAGAYRDRGLVGWDLAGPEAAWPDPAQHRDAFEAARDAGLRITLHAGEWGGAAQVRRALALDPERIAHGAAAADDPSLLAELIQRNVCLDLCPTSNVQAGAVDALGAHPLARLQRAGASVTLSTDSRTVAGLSLSEEYARAIGEIGLAPAELWAIDRRGIDVAFAEEAVLMPLREEFDGWAREEGLIR
jgi:adenosine deaminase